MNLFIKFFWSCNILLRTRRMALYLYFTLKVIIFVVVSLQCRESFFLGLGNPKIFLFWMIYLISSSLYISIHFRDPGYVSMSKQDISKETNSLVVNHLTSKTQATKLFERDNIQRSSLIKNTSVLSEGIPHKTDILPKVNNSIIVDNISNINDVVYIEDAQNRDEENSNEGLEAIKLNEILDDNDNEGDLNKTSDRKGKTEFILFSQPKLQDEESQIMIPMKKETLAKDESWGNVLEAENSVEGENIFDGVVCLDIRSAIEDAESSSSAAKKIDSPSEIKTESRCPDEIHFLDVAKTQSPRIKELRSVDKQDIKVKISGEIKFLSCSSISEEANITAFVKINELQTRLPLSEPRSSRKNPQEDSPIFNVLMEGSREPILNRNIPESQKQLRSYREHENQVKCGGEVQQAFTLMNLCEKEEKELYMSPHYKLKQSLDTFDRGCGPTLDVTNIPTNFQTNINNFNTNPTIKELPKRSERSDRDEIEILDMAPEQHIKPDPLPAVINLPVPIALSQRSSGRNHRKTSAKKSSREQEIFIEKRYCSICNVDQPVRAKHCSICKRCVSTYDHHCPWIGTCIAERNKFLFYNFVIIQFIETIWGAVKTLSCMAAECESWFDSNYLNLVGVLIEFFFCLMVGSLVFYHTYLLSVNLTTWEFLSWKKITYLQEIPRNKGSPFNMGIATNFNFFLKSTFSKEPFQWRYMKSIK